MSDATCHPTGPGQRAIGPRHHGDHDACQECRHTHCASCGRTHLDDPGELTCPRCIGRTRTDLADIAALHDRLEDEAIYHPNDAIPGGVATVLLGAVAFDYGLEQARRIIAAVDAAASVGEQLTDEELERFTVDDPWPGDAIPPLLTLATWEDAFREALAVERGPSRATVETAVSWLSTVLHRVARQDPWHQFAAEVRSARVMLEAVLRDGTRPAVGVPCLECGTRLHQTYADPDPCTHDTAARRHARQLASAGAPVVVVEAALRLARQPCEATDCDQGGRRSRWECPLCRRSYDQAGYARARAHHAHQAVAS